MRAKRICANTFPDTDKREIGHDDSTIKIVLDIIIIIISVGD